MTVFDNGRKRVMLLAATLGVGLGFVACAAFSGSEPSSPATNDAGNTNDGNQPDVVPDALRTNDPPVEAGPTGGMCHGAFGPPTLILAQSPVYTVDTATFTTDELDLFVTLMPITAVLGEKRSVFAMHRAHVGDAFTMDTSQPLDLTETGATPGAFDVGLSADDLTLYFSHRQDPDSGAVIAVDIYEAIRANRDAPFAATTKFASGINDPTTNQFHAHPAGLNLYFTVATTTNGVQGDRDLYVAPLSTGNRSPIFELNMARTFEANPVPSRDELEMFFSSDRDSDAGVNQVYVTSRASASLTFAMPNPVPLSFGAGVSVSPQHLSADRCRLYIIVNQADLYVVPRAAE